MVKANELRIGNIVYHGETVTDIFSVAIVSIDTGFEFWYDTMQGICIQTKGSGVKWNLPSEIKYVHQLQNLYFALTGQELEIKEMV